MKQRTNQEKTLEEKIRRLEERLSLRDEVRVYSPILLTEEDKELLKANFEFINDKTIVNIVDKNLIAGFVLETKEKVIDFSLRNRLSKLKNLLYEISS
jgi:F0F1-type ATP synthase delta subunit